MKFTKYEKRGAYHWREYVRGTKYRKHCDFIKNWVSEKDILDVGAGDGVITYLLNAVGVDNELSAVNIAIAMGVPVTIGDAYNLHYYDDDSFEAVTMIDVLEHFDKPEQALKEAQRVAPVLYIATPERQPEQVVRDRFHVQEWTREELVQFMFDNNYKLIGDIHYEKQGDTLYARFERINSGA